MEHYDYAVLKLLDRKGPMSVARIGKALKRGCDQRVAELAEKGYVEFPIIGYESESGPGYYMGPFPVESDECGLTAPGKVALENCEFAREGRRREKAADNVKYWVTTAIAIIALILSAISIAAQSGLIVLPFPR